MRKKINLAVGPDIAVEKVEHRQEGWIVSATGTGARTCPDCGRGSSMRHSWHIRHLRDLPVQGVPVSVDLRLGRWRCLNASCTRKTFVEKLSAVFPFARRTTRADEIIRLFGHATGGRVGA